MIKKRFKYALVHFLISAVFTALSLWMILNIWYPNIMPGLFGISTVLFIFILVNLILWPFFSALIYKLDKQELKRDLTIMGSLQIIVSTIMLFYLYQSRPIWLVLTIDFFNITRPKDILEDQYPITVDDKVGIFQKYKLFGAEFSSDPEQQRLQRNNDIFGKSIYFSPSALVKLQDKKTNLTEYAKSLDELKKYNPANEVSVVLSQYPEATSYFPIKGFVKDGTMLTNKDFSWFQPVNLWPWEDDYSDFSPNSESDVKKP